MTKPTHVQAPEQITCHSVKPMANINIYIYIYIYILKTISTYIYYEDHKHIFAIFSAGFEPFWKVNGK